MGRWMVLAKLTIALGWNAPTWTSQIGTTRHDHTTAALSNRGWIVNEGVPAVAHNLCLGRLKNFAFRLDIHKSKVAHRALK